MPLTPTAYWDPARPHLSQSMLRLYLESPRHYKEKYVDRTLKRKAPTTSMKRGSAVDALLTQEHPLYEPKIQKTVNKKDDEEAYADEQKLIAAQRSRVPEDHLLPQPLWEEVEAIAQAIKAQPFWQENLPHAQFQRILEGSHKGTPLCGMADRIEPVPMPAGHRVGSRPRFHISDLKITTPEKMASAYNWERNCRKMGYDLQAELYCRLLAKEEKVPRKNISFGHIVACIHDDGFVEVKLFRFTQSPRAWKRITQAITGIKNGMFEPPALVWENAEALSFN